MRSNSEQLKDSTEQNVMSKITKLAVAAVAASALAGSAQAQLVNQFSMNQDQLLLGFRSSSSSSDLVIDLGTASQVGIGSGSTVNLNNNGNVGLSASGLQAELTTLFGGMGNLSFGVVGGHSASQNNNAIYSTVPDGALPPVLGAVGDLNSAANTVGFQIDGSGSPVNQQVVANNQNYGVSWTEQIGSATSLWQRNGTSPEATTPATFTSGTVVEDLYGKVNGVETMQGTITLGADGSVVYAPSVVPEPGTCALVGLGLLAFTLRRRSSSTTV